MTHSTVEPLSIVLQQAGLVSETQLKSALIKLADSDNLGIGELLVRCGLLTQATIDFFAQKWSSLLYQQRQPLGKYFREAGLLSNTQLQAILEEQKQTGQRLGEIAVIKGWLKQNTVDFFVEHLHRRQHKLVDEESDRYDEAAMQAIRDRLLSKVRCRPFWLLTLYAQMLRQGGVEIDDSLEQRELLKADLALKQQGRLVANSVYRGIFPQSWLEKELNRLQPYETTIVSRSDIGSWERLTAEVKVRTNEQKHLTQILCQLLGEYQTIIPAGEEAKWVDEIVRTHIVENWQQGEASGHLRQISDRLLSESGHLLSLYEQVLNHTIRVGGAMPSASWSDGHAKYQPLLALELVTVHHNHLVVHNSIYAKIFDLPWVAQAQASLQQQRTAPAVAVAKPSVAAERAKNKMTHSAVAAPPTPGSVLTALERLAAHRRPSKLSILGGLTALAGLVSFSVLHRAQWLNSSFVASTQTTDVPKICWQYSQSRQEQIEELQKLQQNGVLDGQCQQLKDELLFGHAIETLASNNYRQEAVDLLCEVTPAFFESKQNVIPYFRNWSESSPRFKTWLELYLQNNACPIASYLR
ncbi:MAG: hypothetical protein ACFB4I_20105 [Cyanophyceae cyanobacterium]